jgi:hypothetical protein
MGIYSILALECFAWGLGTAIGELPPYFVARAAALGNSEDDEFKGIQGIFHRLIPKGFSHVRKRENGYPRGREYKLGCFP